ncbi:hypothetical protein ACFX19_016391 [Malus domestica]
MGWVYILIMLSVGCMLLGLRWGFVAVVGGARSRKTESDREAAIVADEKAKKICSEETDGGVKEGQI